MKVFALARGGKDGVIRYAFSGINPQGMFVYGFKQSTKYEAAHDFLRRVPTFAHKLVPHSAWSK